MARQVYARHYKMTARRRAALRKAQIASARKRRNRRKAAKVAVGAGVIAVTMAGSYQRSKRKAAAKNVVQQTTLAGFRLSEPRLHTASVVNGQTTSSAGKEVDIVRFDIKGQISDENSKIDFGKVGTPRTQRTYLTFRRGVAQNKLRKAAKGTRGRRIIEVFSDGSTGPIGARARSKEKEKMNYSPSARRTSYQNARDRIDPPPWLRGLVQRRSERNAIIVRETKAAKQRARRAKAKAKKK